MRRKKRQREMDNELLDAIFQAEAEWKKMRYIVDRSVDSTDDIRYQLKLAESKYMFLLKEAKHRKINALR